ncbi:MAG: histidine kinase dimerization/phosphoacceptor domain -containing protein [Bacteroidota bacterium]
MRKKAFHIIKIFPLFFLLSITSVFSQDQNHKFDSIENTFNEVSGEERIKRVTHFIRYTNLFDYNSVKFTPYIDEAYQWEKKHPNITLLNTIRLGHVNILLREIKLMESVRLLQEILHSRMPVTTEDSLSIYTFLFDIYTNVGSYSKAWEMLRVKDDILSRKSKKNTFINQFKKIGINDLARIYFKTEKYNEAINQYKHLLIIAQEEKNLHYEAGANNNFGLVFLKINKPDSAIIFFNISLMKWTEHLKELDFPTALDSSFSDYLNGNIGHAYNELEEYKKAIPLIRNYINVSTKTKYYIGVVNGLNELSKSFLGIDQPEKAIELLDSASRLIKEKHIINGSMENYENKIKVYEYMGNTDKAYSYYKKLIEYRDSMTRVQNINISTILEIEYEVGLKDKEIANQIIEVEKAEAEVNRQKGRKEALFVAAVLMLTIVLILILHIIQRRKRTTKLKEKSKQIEEQNKIIEKALVEKETLLKEIHHRVKNNLQLISGLLELQVDQTDDEYVKEMMEEGKSRVRSMSLIHEQLYESNDLGKIDFREYLNKLTNDIAIAFNTPEKEINFQIKVRQFSLDINTAVPLGLIVNELIANAYKHAFKGREKGNIIIDLVPVENEETQLRIIDDGIGLPKEFDPLSKRSLGLRLVQGLIRQLGGEYAYECKKGTQFMLQFKNEIFK